ncbi:hypothetical protein ATANTOWER_001822 [Ataeniobius toweri]|uniref:Uncharacterized protein n=1 Tax=Ataeniobius toweri TaxID=208326 RepID=A0ABU7BG18_9TELE|nr:hypothetical protein [Ataeniobius toweri]
MTIGSSLIALTESWTLVPLFLRPPLVPSGANVSLASSLQNEAFTLLLCVFTIPSVCLTVFVRERVLTFIFVGSEHEERIDTSLRLAERHTFRDLFLIVMTGTSRVQATP